MRKFLLILVITMMMTENIYACKTPEELMDNYFNDFSSGDIKKVERNYSFPLIVIQNGNKTIHEKISTFLNFEEIKKTGWKESVINSVMIILKKDKSAVTQVNFSRVNNKGDIYLTTDANYNLIKEDVLNYIETVLEHSMESKSAA